MRALLIDELGRPPRLGEVPEPDPGPGDVVLRVLAAPLNPVDISVARGGFFAGHPGLPYVPGVEAVGEVVSPGGGVPSGRVFTCLNGLGTTRNGTCAEFALAAEDKLVPVPAEIDPALAAALGTAGLAAWLPLTWRAPLQPGETVLVLGATGTVGLVAVQAARLLGAGRVVAAGRRPESLELARRLGADAVVRLDETRDLAGDFREACGPDGANLVFDPLWGEPLVAALEVAAPRARIVQLGQSAGPTAVVASAVVRGKNVDVLGYTNFGVPFDVLAQGYRQLLEHAKKGRLEVDLERVPLENGTVAWGRQESGPGTKLVLCP